MIKYLFLLIGFVGFSQNFYTAAAKSELADRFDNGYSAGTGFYNDISRTITESSTFVSDPDLYRPTYGSTADMPYEGQDLHTTALLAYAKDSVSLANTVVTEILGTVNANDLNSTWWDEVISLPRRLDSDNNLWIQVAKGKKLYDSYKLLEGVETVLTTLEKTTIEDWFDRLAYVTYTTLKARMETYFGSDWHINGLSSFSPEGLYPSAYGSPYPIQDASGNNNTDFIIGWAQDLLTNRNFDAIQYVHLWAIENNDSAMELWSRECVKSWLKYNVFPDGTQAEIFRNEDDYPAKGVWYGWITLGAIVEMAHLDAMTEHYPSDLLYDYSTTDGILNGSTNLTSSAYVGSSTTDGTTPKSIFTALKAQSNYYRSSTNGGWNDLRYFKDSDGITIDAIDPTSYSQPSVITALANTYYKDQDLEDYYLFNTSVGYPAKQSILAGALSGSGYDEDYGPWGNMIQGAMWLEQEDNFFTTTVTPVPDFYTTEAKVELKDRFTNGYVTGTGFGDDITRALSNVATFTSDPTAGRSSFGSSYPSVATRQPMYHAALYAYVKDSVALSNVIANELLATVNANDMSDSYWSSIPNWSTDGNLWLQAAEVKKMVFAWEAIQALETTLTPTEKTTIDTWFADFRDNIGLWVDYYFDNYWSTDWEINGVTKIGDGNLLNTQTYWDAYPLKDNGGSDLTDYGMTGAQNLFNNRIAEVISALHELAIYTDNSTYENIGREWFKNAIRYGLFSDGSYWELARNKNAYSINALGVLYSFSTLSAMVHMAHIDAMTDNYPNDRLYDFETTEGVLNGSSNLTTGVTYQGGSTTDGTTLKSLKTFIIGQSKYYRNTANGGWNDLRYYDSSPLDMTGTSERDYSTPQAIANLYYKDSNIEDFYIYNTSVGYPSKNTFLDGSYEGSDGTIGTSILGAAWLEQENNFFITTEPEPEEENTYSLVGGAKDWNFWLSASKQQATVAESPSNVLVNGSFDTDTYWIKEYFTISGGVATSSTGGYNAKLVQSNIGFQQGETYDVTYTSDVAVTIVLFADGYYGQAAAQPAGTDQTVSITINTTGGSLTNSFRIATASAGTIDDLSVIGDVVVLCTADPNEYHVDGNAASDPYCNEADATTGWSVGTSGTIYVDSTEAYEGDYCLYVEGDGTNYGYMYKDFTCAIGDNLVVSYAAKSDSPSLNDTSIAGWSGVDTSPNNNYVSSSWAEYNHTMVATATTVRVKFFFTVSDEPNKLYVDKFSFINNGQ